ncbi:MAG: SDR family NAD(P)-dependent oxidoreductase [Propionibacteriaceae bacterium]|nr:SDR family NAD(P)-dependent oxidoreductase [Propionibacteriaceae bacterium]
MKKAIVTGHSAGLGAALTAQLAADGFEVLGISRSSGAQLDLGQPKALTEWLESGALREFMADATDLVLINNAGTVAPIAFVGRQDAEAIEQSVNLNVTAPLILTDAVVRERPGGAELRVVHISSGAGRHAYETWSVYCAGKAAVDMHATALAAEQLDGVKVASIAPGVVDTGMQEAIRGADFPSRDRFQALKDEGQLSSPEGAARAIITLLNRSDFGEKVITDVRDA